MSSQLSISFDLHKPEFTCLARKTDPATSIEAGRRAQEKIVQWHERLICDCLRTNGAMTAKEMEVVTGLSNVEISRRTTGLIWCDNPRCKYTGESRNGFKVWGLIG